MPQSKFGKFAAALAITAATFGPIGEAHASPSSATQDTPAIEALEKVGSVPLDKLSALPGFDWSQVKTASLEVHADFEQDRSQYNLTDKETEQLVEDLASELEKELARRADIAPATNGTGDVHITVTISDVDVSLPQSASYSSRVQSFSRWGGSLEVEGSITLKNGGAVLATFTDDVEDMDPFIERRSWVSVRSDMAQLADRSADRIAGALNELAEM